jgi:hypothetical protein
MRPEAVPPAPEEEPPFVLLVREERLPPARRRRHLEMLLAATGVVVLAFVLDVRPDQRVALHWLPDYPLPETCLARSIFGIPCPGCGLTRSFIYLARGDWQQAQALHHLGWLMALAVLLQFPYRLHCLLRGDCSPAMLTASRWFGAVLIVLLVGNWLCLMLLVP